MDLRDVVKALGKAIVSSETLEDKDLPTETHIDSIAWYLLTINPFLDYRCELPGGYRVLMLDFAKRESLLIYDTRLGKNYGYVHPGSGQSRGPRALSCLTRTQQWMVSQFLQLPGKAKVIGIHTPPLGPYPDWSEMDLVRGFKTYGKPLEARGPLTYRFEPSGGGQALKGHPLFAIRPDGRAVRDGCRVQAPSAAHEANSSRTLRSRPPACRSCSRGTFTATICWPFRCRQRRARGTSRGRTWSRA